MYHGPVWGSLPTDFPAETAERIYRGHLDRIGDPTSQPARLMGLGFKGVAYRFRAAAEYDEEVSALFTAHGPGPPADVHYMHEKALFGFFVSGASGSLIALVS